MRIANNSGEALLCSPARRRFAIATRINRFMICPPSDEGDVCCYGLASLGGSRVHARRRQLPSSELQALVCRRNPGSGSTSAAPDPRAGVPSKPAVRGPQVSGYSAPLSSSSRVACDAVNDKPIAPADKRMIYEGKKRPRLNPPPARWRRPVGAVLGM
jgi:hypothetical protein